VTRRVEPGRGGRKIKTPKKKIDFTTPTKGINQKGGRKGLGIDQRKEWRGCGTNLKANYNPHTMHHRHKSELTFGERKVRQEKGGFIELTWEEQMQRGFHPRKRMGTTVKTRTTKKKLCQSCEPHEKGKYQTTSPHNSKRSEKKQFCQMTPEEEKKGARGRLGDSDCWERTERAPRGQGRRNQRGMKVKQGEKH